MKAYTQQTKFPKWYLAYAKAMASQYPDLTVADRLAELYKRLSWVATAIDVVSIIAAMAGKSVKKMAKEQEEEIINHDFELLLLDPNPIQSGKSFIFSIVADYKLHNKAFIWMNIVNSKPIELWRIPPTMIVPVASGKMGIAYFEYDPGFGVPKIQIPVEQIVYWQGYDPDNLIDPSSNLTSLSLTATSDMKMQKWNQNVYDGNGRLPGVLHFADMIPDDQWEQIGDDIDTAASTQNILRLRGTGTGAIGYIQTSSPPKDMEFYIGRDNNRDEIWTRIAPGLVSAMSDTATEANSRTGKATLIDLTVYPVLEMLYETMTQQIVWRYYGKELKIEPEDIRVTDRVLELQETAEYSKTATVNEVRTKKWKLEKLTDERGDMLVAEAQAYKTEAPKAPVGLDGKPALPFGQKPDEEDKKKLPPNESNQQRDAEAQKEQVAAKAVYPIMEELSKWERMAVKSPKKALDFQCYNVPHELETAIKAELPKSASEAAIKAIFDNARSETMPPMIDESRVSLTLEAIREALAFKVKG